MIRLHYDGRTGNSVCTQIAYQDELHQESLLFLFDVPDGDYDLVLREIELLPCPCCGISSAEFFNSPSGDGIDRWFIGCTICGIRTSSPISDLYTKASVSKIWNTRKGAEK